MKPFRKLLICAKCKMEISGAKEDLQKTKRGNYKLAIIISEHFKLYPECAPEKDLPLVSGEEDR